MRIVDLFAGLEGWGGPHRQRHRVVTTDIDPRFGSDITADVLEADLGARIIERLGGRPDLVLASPPCEAFSVLTIGRNWTGPKDVPAHAPKTDQARFALRLVERTLELIEELEPAFYVIENPRAKLRALPVLAGLERRTVTYCRLGLELMKPTDLWGGFPPSLVLPAPCDTRNGERVQIDGRTFVVDRTTGAPCHISAPRGSTTGVQGEGALFAGGSKRRKDWSAIRAKVPEMLSQLVVEAAGRDLEAGRQEEPVEMRLF